MNDKLQYVSVSECLSMNDTFSNISVNEELYASGPFETMSIDADEDEHSIEMHLPYIAKVMER